MRKLILIMALSGLLMMAGAVMAQDGNDPADNWCYDGGPLEGRCTMADEAQTRWMWLYGFFRAQIAKGALSVADIPAEYQIGLVDSAAQNVEAVRDADGNVISGRSSDFQGTISTCEKGSSTTTLGVIWLGLDIAGDRIEISTPEGSVSANTYIPTSGVDVDFKIGKSVDKITPGGTMSIYYRGVLIGRSDLNGLNECPDDD